MHTPIIKFTCILFALLATSFCKLTAQITINDVLGDYICNVNNGTSTVPYCTGTKLRFIKQYSSMYSSCDTSLMAQDSGCINMFGNIISFDAIITVFGDSTLHDCSRSNILLGNYKSNDSIYLKITDYPNPGYYEYFGKKIITSINELNLNAHLKIYPNPVKSILTIELTNTNLWYKQSIITIKNSLGQVIKTEELNNKQQQMDVGKLPYGIYFMEVTTLKGILSKKIMVIP